MTPQRALLGANDEAGEQHRDVATSNSEKRSEAPPTPPLRDQLHALSRRVNPHAPEPSHTDKPSALGKRWYTPQDVADILGFGIYKARMLLITREMRSIKDGKYRRILPEWVDEYVARRVEEADQ